MAFFIDDILLSPAKSLWWMLKEIGNAVQREQQEEAERLTAKLRTLYMQLETGRITDDEFDEAEAQILERLDELRDMALGEEEEDDEDGDDADAIDEAEAEHENESDPATASPEHAR